MSLAQDDPQRYHLIVSYACPYAHRTILARALFGLTDSLSLSVVHPRRVDNKWAFVEDAELGVAAQDPVFPEAKFVADIYAVAPPPNWDKANSVPLLIDKQTKQAVSQQSADIVQFLAGLKPTTKANTGGLQLDALNPEQVALGDELMKVWGPAAGATYKAKDAKNQADYNTHTSVIEQALNRFEEELSKHRWIAGETWSKYDLLLWPFLLRWDILNTLISRFYMPLRGGGFPSLCRWVVDFAESHPDFIATYNHAHIQSAASHYLATPFTVKVYPWQLKQKKVEEQKKEE